MKSFILALLWLTTSRALTRCMRSLASCRMPLCASIDMTSLDILGRPAQPCSAKTTEGMGVGSSELVVKVYSVHNAVNPHLPWTSKAQEESTGSGFSIKHDGVLCILTNAHVVADATYVEVRKAGDSRKYVALRRKISHECDLATLTVDDGSFWRETAPLAFGAVPCLQDEVSVVGYPEGGEGVSVTVGVVSRIEIQRYAHSGAKYAAFGAPNPCSCAAHELQPSTSSAPLCIAAVTLLSSPLLASPRLARELSERPDWPELLHHLDYSGHLISKTSSDPSDQSIRSLILINSDGADRELGRLREQPT